MIDSYCYFIVIEFFKVPQPAKANITKAKELIGEIESIIQSELAAISSSSSANSNSNTNNGKLRGIILINNDREHSKDSPIFIFSRALGVEMDGVKRKVIQR